ncbi:relaxin-3 receptor 1 [Chiloscyllium plagiosum]|uniref:relaxin-3 receptor 1 n=1 Tax=Chiloscyllium plagiosum TaxID=36176 RepID=UPI001CB7B074|nr:relaxin-3 receptor 1 [Chiloscyllium plagiosum]
MDFDLIASSNRTAAAEHGYRLRTVTLAWFSAFNRSNESRAGEPLSGDLEAGGGSSAAARIIMSVVYSVVCALGLLGNLLVLYLMKSRRSWKKSSINLFVTGLAATDFQFVLTLPFWAVDTALDFSWPFGSLMCKLVSLVTVMNMYASVFFLTAMSIARYWSVASALKPRSKLSGCSAMWVSMVIWISAALASIPHAVFSTTTKVSNEELCVLKFPDYNGSNQFWLGLYQIQKVLLGFLIPLVLITVCYLLLLRYVTNRNISSSSASRRSRVTKSVTIVVLSFFLCWLPNQALTFWGVLVKLNAVQFSSEYYTAQSYVFPITVCLAHTNSCLNPILYCLMRREFRKALKGMFWRISSPTIIHMRPFTASTKPEQDEQRHVIIPKNPVQPPEVLYYPPGAVMCNGRYDILPANSVEPRY